jgi:hypothetical protein
MDRVVAQRPDDTTEKPAASGSKTKKKAKAPPPHFDRSGEMPDDAVNSAAAPEAPIAKEGLAGVDLLSDEASIRPTSKYEEYKADGDEEPRRTDTPDEPIRGEIEVVKVKRKKKKESSKKKIDA